MPLLNPPSTTAPEPSSPPQPVYAGKQSQLSSVARSAIMSKAKLANADAAHAIRTLTASGDLLLPPMKPLPGRPSPGDARKVPDARLGSTVLARAGVGSALTDTPLSTAPNSPQIVPFRRDSAGSNPRARPTTLDIPGLTKSRLSPDGRISSRDIGSKLVIVMVGLPARGKSYITRKMARYLNWLQHDTQIFNVGERRREVASGSAPAHFEGGERATGTDAGVPPKLEQRPPDGQMTASGGVDGEGVASSASRFTALPPPILSITSENGDEQNSPTESIKEPASPPPDPSVTPEPMDQTADFFDPKNKKASRLRERIAMETLDELLDYILDRGGSVGILDATNSTLERRKAIIRRVRERAGPELGVLFLESLCIDEHLLESNMRLKLSGPDYKDQDPVTALADFRKRVEMYKHSYVPLGAFEERHNMQYIQMIDVGRKIVAHQIRGFLAAQAVYYLVNFNLSPRQIWITRHGESTDNVRGRIGGNSELSANGLRYSRALTRFIDHERRVWTVKQQDLAASTHFPPLPGDCTPPYLTSTDGEAADKSFCVWTSMLSRSIQTAQFFDEDEYEIKQMKMLDELRAGDMEGMTHEEIRSAHGEEHELRKRDKLHYRYPGAGGEGYLDVINRLRAVIVEIERMTDHLLLVCHRSVARVLLAYFLGLDRDAVADVDVPLGILYMLEPKPYGVDFRVYRYDPEDDWFHVEPGYELRRSNSAVDG